MSNSAPGRDGTPDATKIAAVMAAVQAYLNEETSERVPDAGRPQRLWRTALWPQLRRGTPWKGRN